MKSRQGELVVSYLTLRQMIGWIGLAMPITVRLGAYLFSPHIHSTESISAYYYTGMRDVFVSTLVLVGVLLACYRTPSRIDNAVAIIAGLAAIGIGLFPMNPTFAEEIIHEYPLMAPNADGEKCYVIRGFLHYHFVFVSIFFALSFYLVYFRFSAFTPPAPTRQKLARNKVYKWCGAVMFFAFATIGIQALTTQGGSIFWPEAAAVVAFAVAWLVKGRTFLKDPEPVQVAG
jgi:hypothetical protein